MRSFERTHAEEMEIALSALDCALNGDRAVYASSEITTGLRLKRLLLQHNLRSAEALKELLGQEEFQRQVIDFNVRRACYFAHALRERFRGQLPVVTPGPFVVPDWSQPEYLEFWTTLIRTRADRVFFNDGWEYSNGCTLEYAAACEAGIPTYQAGGAPLCSERAIELVVDALDELRTQHIDSTTLERNLGSIEAACRRHTSA